MYDECRRQKYQASVESKVHVAFYCASDFYRMDTSMHSRMRTPATLLCARVGPRKGSPRERSQRCSCRQYRDCWYGREGPAQNPRTCRLCRRTVYALDETKGGDVLQIRKKVGCWLSNPFRRSDRFGGKEDNPMSHPPHLREKWWF